MQKTPSGIYSARAFAEIQRAARFDSLRSHAPRPPIVTIHWGQVSVMLALLIGVAIGLCL